MFSRRITLFKLFGFAVRLDASWLIIAALVIWSLASGYFPYTTRGLPQSAYWWMGIAGAFGLFGSIVIHELFHSLVARRFGLEMRGITLFVFGGIAEMEEEPDSAKSEFLMAVAGPVASVLLGFLFWALAIAGKTALSLELTAVLSYLSGLNFLLAAFNMIPAFPLDGGRVLRAALWHFKRDQRRATAIASRIGAGFGVLLMAAGVFQLFRNNFVGAVWWFLIGMFLRNAAQSSYQRLVIRAALAGEPVRRFMRSDPITVPRRASIRELVDDYIYSYHHKLFPVVGDTGELIGCVTTERVKTVPREEWDRRTVGEISAPCSENNTIRPDDDAAHALELMNGSETSRLMVVENGRVTAVLSPRDILSFLATKLDLEGVPATEVSEVVRRDRTRTAGGH